MEEEKKPFQGDPFCYERLINNMNILNKHTGTDISKATLILWKRGNFPEWKQMYFKCDPW